MRTRSAPWILLSAALSMVGLTNGCRTTAAHREETACVLARAPVLVLLPLADRTDNTAVSCRQFGDYLFQEFSDRSAAQAIRAEQVGALTGTISSENLIRSGDFCLDEAAAQGKLAQCRSVVAAQILEFKPYPPQRLAVRIVWVDVDTAQLLCRLHLQVDLADPQTRDDYTRFVHQHESVARLLTSSDPNRSYVETALLSPRLFHRFSAQRAADALTASSGVGPTHP